MISLVNVGPLEPIDGPVDENVVVYYIQIGHTLIESFQHNIKDGLAICFDKAAEAIRQLEVAQ